MNFASEFIYDCPEEEYEYISDEEFRHGMQVSSESDDSDDELSEPVPPRIQNLCYSDSPCQSSQTQEGSLIELASRPPPVPKRKGFISKIRQNWKKKSEQRKKQGDEEKHGWYRRADTNVVSVTLDTLLKPGNMHAGDPVKCQSCLAFMSHISKTVCDGNDKTWCCDFCGDRQLVDVEDEEIPTKDDVTYLVEPGRATSSAPLSGIDESLIIFCMDISGSMCVTSELEGRVKLRGTSQLQRLQSFNTEGEDQYLPSQRSRDVTYISRLQAMQAAVDHQLGDMAKEHPNRRVGLITFNNDVTIIGDGNQEEVTIAGAKLTNKEELEQIGQNTALPQGISASWKKLSEKVYTLEEGGSTALGPALVVAVNMASHHPGSKVIICTDGKANTGLGKLEDEEDENEGTGFYSSIGETAVDKGVSISVITIKGTDCKLVHLGMLADKTGGQVNIVDPLKLTQEFGNILADAIIATKVKARFHVYKELYIVDETDPENMQCMKEVVPGSVKSSTTVTFQFSRRLPENKGDKTESKGQGDTQNGNETKSSNSANQEQVAEVGKIETPKTAGETEEKSTKTAEAADTAMEEAAAPAEVEGAGSTTSATKDQTSKDFPFQLQIAYTDTEGTKALRVLTKTLPSTMDRKLAEDYVNLEVLGAHTAQKAAGLALAGHYTTSRSLSLLNQRLAWRYSHTSANAAKSDSRTKYRNIYTELKTMENRLQKKQEEERTTYGTTYSDDEDGVYEDQDGVRDAPPLPLACSRAPATKGRIASFFAKKQLKSKRAMRSSEMDDSLANMVYQFHSAAGNQLSSKETSAKETPSAPAPSQGHHSSSDSDCEL